MDIYPRTDFPDIRRKTTVHSKAGALLIIPREGGFMVRFYMQMPTGTTTAQVTLQTLHERARQILTGYTLEIPHTVWWSAYSIGQRLASELSADGRIFLAGDACHTHSPKAGQGMNISLQDGYNIGWKLAQVLKGRAAPELLRTYTMERQQVAADLIAFDRRLTGLYSASASSKSPTTMEDVGRVDAFKDHFLQSAQYMAGLSCKYDDSMVTSSSGSDQALARNILVGMRLPSAQVVRYYDARSVQLVTALPSDGQWRVLVFAGDGTSPAVIERLDLVSLSVLHVTHHLLTGQFARALEKANGSRSIEAELLLVLGGDRTAIEETSIPQMFRPQSGPWQLQGKSAPINVDQAHSQLIGFRSPQGLCGRPQLRRGARSRSRKVWN